MPRFARLALLPILVCSSWASSGCDISAKSFAGTIIQMQLTGVPTDAAGQHVELWARNQYDDVVRVSGIYDFIDILNNNKTTRLFPDGFVIRPAITMDDPCMIDLTTGGLLTKAEAYKDSDAGGVHQTPEEQAQQVRSRIAQVTSSSSCDGSPVPAMGTQEFAIYQAYHCGHQQSTILGVTPYELVDDMGNATNVAPEPLRTCETSGNAPGCIPYDAAPADRLKACQDYWRSSPLAYSPNPLQLTAPIHSTLYGEVFFFTPLPPTQYDSIRIDSNVGLKGIRELWMTTEPDQVDAKARGPIILDGTPGPGGLGIVHFELSPPFGSSLPFSGSAALEVDLDEDPVQF